MKEQFELLNTPWNYPDRISETLSYTKRLGRAETTEGWLGKAPPSMISAEPKPHVVKFFAQQGIPATFLDEADVRDDGLVMQLFSLALHVSPSLSLPEVAKKSAPSFWRWPMRGLWRSVA